MLAIGNDELSDILIIEGDELINTTTNEITIVEYAKDSEGNKTNKFCFVKLINEDCYLVGINSRLINNGNWKKVN